MKNLESSTDKDTDNDHAPVVAQQPHHAKPQPHPQATEAAHAAVGRMPNPLDSYPHYREITERLLQESRAMNASYRKQTGVGDWVVDKAESASETVHEWYAWMTNAKQAKYPDPHLAMPPVAIWDAVDVAIANADRAYETRDPVLLRQRMTEIGVTFRRCSERETSYLDRHNNGANLALQATETTAMTASTIAGYAAGGPAGAAASAAVMRMTIVATEAHADGEKFDWKKVGLSGVKEAATTLVFALAAGPLGQKVFQPLLVKALGPALTSALGASATQSVERYLAGFLAGTGTGAVLNAVEIEVARIHGGAKMTDREFAQAVVENMMRGGVQQLFIDAITHGAGHAANATHPHATPTHEAHEVSAQTGRTRQPAPQPAPTHLAADLSHVAKTAPTPHTEETAPAVLTEQDRRAGYYKGPGNPGPGWVQYKELSTNGQPIWTNPSVRDPQMADIKAKFAKEDGPAFLDAGNIRTGYYEGPGNPGPGWGKADQLSTTGQPIWTNPKIHGTRNAADQEQLANLKKDEGPAVLSPANLKSGQYQGPGDPGPGWVKTGLVDGSGNSVWTNSSVRNHQATGLVDGSVEKSETTTATTPPKAVEAPKQTETTTTPSNADAPAVLTAADLRTGYYKGPGNPGPGWVKYNELSTSGQPVWTNPSVRDPQMAEIKAKFAKEDGPAFLTAGNLRTGYYQGPGNPGPDWVKADHLSTSGEPIWTIPKIHDAGIAANQAELDKQNGPAILNAGNLRTGYYQGPGNPGPGWVKADHLSTSGEPVWTNPKIYDAGIAADNAQMRAFQSEPEPGSNK